MMNARLLAEKAVQSLRQDGLRATLRKCLCNLKRGGSLDDFDLRYGTDTGGIEPLWKFKVDSPNARFGARYQATQEQELTDSVGFLQEDLNTFTFVDLGCGKGRTLVIASSLGFKHIIGVEFVRELAEIAKSNLEKMNIVNAVVLHVDAADFRFPDTNLVVYLYNPFSVEVLRKVVWNLQEYCSRRLYVIYKTPQCADAFDSSGFLKRLESPPGAQHIRIWSTAG